MEQDDSDKGISNPRSTPSPAWRAGLASILGRLRLHYPGQPMTEDQARLFWEDYVTDLHPTDLRVIDAACARWRQSDEQFFPNPGQLRKICAGVLSERRPQREMNYAEKLERDGWRPPTAEEKAKVTVLMARVRARRR